MVKKDNKTVGECVKYCLRLLSISPRTEKELSQRLKARGCCGESSGWVLEFLKKERFLDDLAFSRERIMFRMRSNPIGRAAIEHELEKKGVTAAVVAEAFAGLESVFDESELAFTAARKKLSEPGRKKNEAVRAKLYRCLSSKGFSEGIVEDVVRKLLGDE